MTALTPELVMKGYRSGIFPMAERRDDPEVFWVDPRRRGIIPLDGFRISRSLARRLRRQDYSVTVNTAFEDVLEACADRTETWINDPIRQTCIELHARGEAHSLEVWQDGALAGGVYGLSLGAAFCGESMFSRRTDASKVALAWLVDRLNLAGFTLFDVQFVTTHLESLGAVEIDRRKYQALLKEALTRDADFTAPALPACGQEVLQRRTQTS
ncbi:leucyl/phenylalanyl-tRNA--protein transferase [Primorskyibacter sedentarius]|uniref:Leucyl/phenylalanyl-tRNA--protein transferase n=1 Tax=Primorskyibacter sedentarius TaxID=745311 RepID=A0A4R3JLL6_9RHOB|nr:leucyl/phenylalanyl-tRNA--protein transferase [Primorskyibacter sedentarius]TCS67226.1 leucyl/phenylalanyl-tRNA--protein transferase [Primorskyibacter sedentarius]